MECYISKSKLVLPACNEVYFSRNSFYNFYVICQTGKVFWGHPVYQSSKFPFLVFHCFRACHVRVTKLGCFPRNDARGKQ